MIFRLGYILLLVESIYPTSVDQKFDKLLNSLRLFELCTNYYIRNPSPATVPYHNVNLSCKGFCVSVQITRGVYKTTTKYNKTTTLYINLHNKNIPRFKKNFILKFGTEC